MDELERARIRVYLNDPEGRGERLVDTAPPLHVDEGAWAFRVEGPAPDAKPFATDTPEFLYWQLASALERGKRLWTRRIPSGRWVPGNVLPAEMRAEPARRKPIVMDPSKLDQGPRLDRRGHPGRRKGDG